MTDDRQAPTADVREAASWELIPLDDAMDERNTGYVMGWNRAIETARGLVLANADEGLREAVESYIAWQYRMPGARRFTLTDLRLRAAIRAETPATRTDALDASVSLHPGQHEFRTVCRLCGEDGFLHVAVITHHERVSITDARLATPPEAQARREAPDPTDAIDAWRRSRNESDDDDAAPEAQAEAARPKYAANEMALEDDWENRHPAPIPERAP